MEPDPLSLSQGSMVMDGSFVILGSNSANLPTDTFKVFITAMEATISHPLTGFVELLTSEGGGATSRSIEPASKFLNWAQTFPLVYSLQGAKYAHVDISICDVVPSPHPGEQPIYRRLAWARMPLVQLVQYHNALQVFNLVPVGPIHDFEAKITLAFYFEGLGAVMEALNTPVVQPIPVSHLGNVSAQQQQPPTLPARTHTTPPPIIASPTPDPASIKQLDSEIKSMEHDKSSTPTSSKPETIVSDDHWFNKHIQEDHPNNISSNFTDMWDLLADPTNATQIFGDMPEPKHCIFLFVAGLYAGRMPFKVAKDVNQMYAERMGELQRLGLDARIVQVPIDGNVLLNATIISTLIQDLHQQFPDKKFVLVGYSKGGVDITAALSIMPQIAVHVRCVITMFSPLFGSHIASDLNASGPRRYIVSKLVEFFMKMDPEAMQDLTRESRRTFWAKYKLPSDIPIVCLTSSVLDSESKFKYVYRYIKASHNVESDGVVACRDAVFAHARYIIIPRMDHKGAHENNPKYNDPVKLFAAVIATALGATRDFVSPSYNRHAPPPLPLRVPCPVQSQHQQTPQQLVSLDFSQEEEPQQYLDLWKQGQNGLLHPVVEDSQHLPFQQQQWPQQPPPPQTHQQEQSPHTSPGDEAIATLPL